MKFKNEILTAMDNLRTDQWITFCFVKILHCNGAYACSFSKAWCKTQRNLDDVDENKRLIVLLPDLFDFEVITKFLEKDGDIDNKMTENQIAAFDRLITFLENIEETSKKIEGARAKAFKESSWAAILGVHVLRQLAVSNEMMIDSGYADKTSECPCGCRTPLCVGDNSIGHKDVWHGSLDIILGPVAVIVQSTDDSHEESSTAFELKTGELEESRNQIIAESIVFSFIQRTGLIPTVGISTKEFKVFMYDPHYDLLYESSELSLFDGRGDLKCTSVFALWLVINHAEFCTGVKSCHETLGYIADFQSLVQKPVLSIYETELHRGGCKHVKSSVWKYSAFDVSGKYKVIE
ncbi:uncharacterized protein LOC127863211 [Dreissena polymorpha]|uniref:uncharacterized protein LOC127863211 n=1 Tax=Dreissena polymorpha TaxID=45954 RepID=UPI0022642D2F|nr:uncharacterized protein LOC127863211 [Dreissena polymorpha]